MHTREQSFSSGAVSFASELIKLYQDSLGPWSSKIVSLRLPYDYDQHVP